MWLHNQGLLDVLALSSTVYAEIFARYGINSLVVPRGYHPDYGSLLRRERDIAVIWMGKRRTRRRQATLSWLQNQLKQRGLVMHIYDGYENNFIFDEERTQLLNRTRFVLNIFFSGPTDELSIRYYVAAANGAVMLTEPGQNKYPFIPGKHLVECPLEKMPDTIEYYLNHQAEWSALSNAMLEFMRREVTLEKSISRILTQAENMLEYNNRALLKGIQ